MSSNQKRGEEEEGEDEEKRNPEAQKYPMPIQIQRGKKENRCWIFLSCFFSSEVVLPCGFFCLSVFSMRLCCGETKMPVKALDAFKKEKKERRKLQKIAGESRLVFTGFGPAAA